MSEQVTAKEGLEFEEKGIVTTIGKEISVTRMSRVYEATQVTEDGTRDVILKVLLPPPPGEVKKPDSKDSKNDHEDSITRFFREIQILTGLKSDYVVPIHSYGEKIGPYYTMDFMPGNLERMLEERELTIEGSIDLLYDSFQALKFLGEKGVVHRDIKPGNIFTDSDGRGRIGDLGLGKEGSSAQLTQTESAMGTPSYMAPEQWIDAKNAGSPADVYGLGASFFHVLTGELLFQRNTISEMLAAHVDTEAEWPQERNYQFPETYEWVEDLLMMTVEKKELLRPTPNEALAIINNGSLVGDTDKRSLDAIMTEINAVEKSFWKRVKRVRVGDTDDDWVKVKVENSETFQWALEHLPSDRKQDLMLRMTPQLEKLASLHFEAGLKTPRYKMEDISRLAHFELANTYAVRMNIINEEGLPNQSKTQVISIGGAGDVEETVNIDAWALLPKYLALERRRRAMLERRIENSDAEGLSEEVEADILKGLIGEKVAHGKKFNPQKRLMKQVIGGLGVIAVAGITGLATTVSVSNSNLDEVRTQREAASVLIDNGQYDAATAKLAEARTTRNSLFILNSDAETKWITSLEGKIGNHTTAITDVTAQKAELGSAYQELKIKFDAGTFDGEGVAALEKKVSEFRASIGEKKTHVHSSEYTQLLSNHKAYEGLLADLKKSLGANTSTIADVTKTENGLDTDYKTLVKSIEDGKYDTSIVQGLRDKVTKAQEVVDKKKSAIPKEYSKFTRQLSNLDIKLEDLASLTQIGLSFGKIQTTYEALRRNINTENDYNLQDASRFKQNVQDKIDAVNGLKIKTALDSVWAHPTAANNLRKNLQGIVDNVIILESMIAEKADVDYVKAEKSLKEANGRLSGLVDRSRDGALDAADNLKRHIDEAVALSKRSEAGGKDIQEFQRDIEEVRAQYTELRTNIEWYSSRKALVDKKEEGAEAAAFDLGKWHFEQYFDTRTDAQLKLAGDFFGRSGNIGEAYSGAVKHINDLFNPDSYNIVIEGPADKTGKKPRIDQKSLELYLGQVEVYKKDSVKTQMIAAVTQLKSLAAALEFPETKIKSLEYGAGKYRDDRKDDEYYKKIKTEMDEALDLFASQARARFEKERVRERRKHITTIRTYMQNTLSLPEQTVNKYIGVLSEKK